MKIVIAPRTFGKTDPEVFNLIKEYGIEADINNSGVLWSAEEFAERIKNSDGAIVGVEKITAELLDANPKLKAISKYGVGLDNIDLEACKERGVRVSKTTGANAMAVGEYAFGMALDLVRNISKYDREVRLGKWSAAPTPDMGTKTFGIIGLGSIGKVVASRAKGFEMKVLAYNHHWDNEYAKNNGIEYAEPDQIFAEADFISIHVPLTPSTIDYIGARELSIMKPTAVLVNTSRGGIINEDALYNALRNHKIYGAGLDVFADEPIRDNRWFTLDNVLLSPHAAGQSYGATESMGRMAVDNIARDLGISKLF